MPGTRQTWQAASTEAGKFVRYPANLAGGLYRGKEVCLVPGKLGRRPLPRQGSLSGTRQTGQAASTEVGKFVRYPVNLAGGLYRGREVCPVPGKLGRRPLPRQGSLSDTRQTWQAASTEARKFVWYPVNLAGVPDALIFFCFLFFHQGKKRKAIKGRKGRPSKGERKNHQGKEERSQRNVPDMSRPPLCYPCLIPPKPRQSLCGPCPPPLSSRPPLRHPYLTPPKSRQSLCHLCLRPR